MQTPEETRSDARAWLADNWDPTLPRTDWMERVVDGGWAALSWPATSYGRDLSAAHSRAAADEFATVGAAGTGHDLGNLWANIIHASGSAEIEARHLRGALTGEKVYCLLYSEPGAGSDLAAVQTRAVRDGDEWLVDGQKVWTSMERAPDYGFLLARTDTDVPKHKGMTYFIVPMDQPGVEVRPIKMATGQSHFNEVFLDQARAPHHDILGGVGGGWRFMQTALVHERAVMAGGVPKLFPSSRPEEEKKPTAWDAHAGSTFDHVALAARHGMQADPHIRQRLARVHTLRQLNRWNAQRARAARRQGVDAPVSALGKLLMTAILSEGAELQAAILGAGALVTAPDSSEGRDTELALLNTFINSIGGGTDEIQRNILGERVLGLPREPAVDRDIPFKDVLKSSGMG